MLRKLIATQKNSRCYVDFACRWDEQSFPYFERFRVFLASWNTPTPN